MLRLTPYAANFYTIASLTCVMVAGLLLKDTTIAANGPTMSVDLVLVNGNFATVDEANPAAQAIAITGDRILAVGSNERIQKLIAPTTKIIDLEGNFATPGFIEGHAHFIGLGQSMMMLNLSTAKSWSEIEAQVAAAAQITPPGQWIVGRGWHQAKWDQLPSPNVEGYPTSDALSQMTPDHPVLLTHASGHMSFANEHAMRLAGINVDTQPPAGGEILRNDEGRPIGVFRETAQSLIAAAKARADRQLSPSAQAVELATAIDLATTASLQNGITSFHDAGSSFEVVDVLRERALAGNLQVRMFVMLRDSNERLEARIKDYKMIGVGNGFLTVRAIKRSIDGALGPHGAWLLAPYEDLPSSSGLNTEQVESVNRAAEIAIENGFQLCVHAIGDRANREVLDIYESQFQKHASPLDRRWRIEHAQHLHPDDIARFGKLNVIASMQAVHCTSDAVFVPQRLGLRRSEQGAYMWRSLMDSGAVVTNGTDAPVESINPLNSFYASVTRRLTPEITFFPEQCVSREEALQTYTINAAYSAFEESSKGSLVPGKLADITVWSKDLLRCPETEIKSAVVCLTVVGGQVVFQR